MHPGLIAQLMRAAAAALVGAGASLLALTGVRAQSAPLVIAKQGYFFVGGSSSLARRHAAGRATCMWNIRSRRSCSTPTPW